MVKISKASCSAQGDPEPLAPTKQAFGTSLSKEVLPREQGVSWRMEALPHDVVTGVLHNKVAAVEEGDCRVLARRCLALPHRGAIGVEYGFAIQTTVLLVELVVYQMEKVRAFVPSSWKPQEKVPSGEMREILS